MSRNQSIASFVAVRIPHLLAATLLTGAIAANAVAQNDDDEDLDLSRLVFEVAAIPTDAAANEAATGPAGAAVAGGVLPGDDAGASAADDAASSANLSADISAYRARIADTQANENSYSAALREQFDSLGVLLQQVGDHEGAIAAFESAMHIDRVNSGLYTLDQIPLVEKIIASHEALGNLSEVDDLHEYLFYIKQKTFAEGDPRLLAAKEEWADWNVESYLKQPPADGFLTFGTGIPSSIDRNAGYVAVQTRDGSFVYVPRTYIGGAMAPLGSRSLLDPMYMSTYGMDAERVIDERLRTARDYYEEIVEAQASSGAADAQPADEYRVEHKLANVAYAVKSQLENMDTIAEQGSLYYNRVMESRQNAPLAVTRGYRDNRDTLEAIAQELEQDAAATPLKKAQAYIDVGDWNIAYDYSGRAEEAYRKAWELLSAAGMDAAAIDAVFMPEPLVAAPAFVTHPYSREMYGFGPEDELANRGYMDLTVDVSRSGDVRGLDIDAASPGTLQVIRSELLDYLRAQKMRPAVVDGETVKREDVKLRYYYGY